MLTLAQTPARLNGSALLKSSTSWRVSASKMKSEPIIVSLSSPRSGPEMMVATVPSRQMGLVILVVLKTEGRRAGFVEAVNDEPHSCGPPVGKARRGSSAATRDRLLTFRPPGSSP